MHAGSLHKGPTRAPKLQVGPACLRGGGGAAVWPQPLARARQAVRGEGEQPYWLPTRRQALNCGKAADATHARPAPQWASSRQKHSPDSAQPGPRCGGAADAILVNSGGSNTCGGSLVGFVCVGRGVSLVYSWAHGGDPGRAGSRHPPAGHGRSGARAAVSAWEAVTDAPSAAAKAGERCSSSKGVLGQACVVSSKTRRRVYTNANMPNPTHSHNAPLLQAIPPCLGHVPTAARASGQTRGTAAAPGSPGV